jgi:hypothetical protein
MNPIPDPRKLLNQLQVLTAASRYALLRKATNQRIINEVKR